MRTTFNFLTTIFPHPTKIAPKNQYNQTLRIEITTPKGATIETLPLVFTRDQVEIVRALLKASRFRRHNVLNNQEVWLLRYNGTLIFFPSAFTRGGKKDLFLVLGRWLDPEEEINVEVIANGLS